MTLALRGDLMDRFDVPVVLFTFKRIIPTRMVMEVIAKVKPTSLYIFADGARNSVEGENEKVLEVREYIKKAIDWDCEKNIFFSEFNKGCDRNIREGLDKVFSEKERAIVLEDDAVPTESFFYYCRELLDRYQEDKRIQFIGGYNAVGNDSKISGSYAFSKTPPMNGAIATWADRWNNCDFDLKNWPENKRKNRFDSLYFSGELRKRYIEYFELSYEKKSTAWDYIFLHDMLDKDRFGIVPKNNLVTSYGFMDGAYHPQRKDETERFKEMMTASEIEEVYPIKAYPEVTRNEAYDRMRQDKLLAVRGSFIKRRILDVYLLIKNVAYNKLPRKHWNMLKKIIVRK